MKKLLFSIFILVIILPNVYAKKFKAFSYVDNNSFVCVLYNGDDLDIKDSISFLILARDAVNKDILLFESCPRIWFGNESGFDFSGKKGFYSLDYSGNTDKDTFFCSAFRPIQDVEATECVLFALNIVDGEVTELSESGYDFTVYRVINLLTSILYQKTRLVFTDVETHEKQVIQIEVEEDYAIDVLSDLNDFITLIY